VNARLFRIAGYVGRTWHLATAYGRRRQVDTLTLRNAALHLQRGGVGYYPRSGFLHVDTGPLAPGVTVA
jgi:hypothetical protein